MDVDEKELYSIMKNYKDEADKCKQSGASLAACVMLGASLEAALLTMEKCYPDEVTQTQTYLKKKEHDLNKWDLIDHLKVAREFSWIPSKLSLEDLARTSGIDPEEALKNGDIGYFADAVREIRDMLHPGRYLRLWSGVRVTKEYVETCYEVVDVVQDLLYKKLIDSIAKEIGSSRSDA